MCSSFHAFKEIHVKRCFTQTGFRRVDRTLVASPRVVGEVDDAYIKVAKVQGSLAWHSHENEDELFMVFKGTLLMDFRDGRTVDVKEGEILIVPKGVEHRPHTNGEIVFNLLFEPKETLHTGNVESEKTVKNLQWL